MPLIVVGLVENRTFVHLGQQALEFATGKIRELRFNLLAIGSRNL